LKRSTLLSLSKGPHDLHRHAANKGGIAAAAAAQNRCNCQQTPNLRPIPAAPGMRHEHRLH